LKTRGSGDLYGNIQSGFLSQIKIADLSNFELIKKAQKWTNEIFISDPDLKNHKELKEKMGELIKNVHLE
jgi:RecG-like helicase